VVGLPEKLVALGSVNQRFFASLRMTTGKAPGTQAVGSAQNDGLKKRSNCSLQALEWQALPQEDRFWISKKEHARKNARSEGLAGRMD